MKKRGFTLIELIVVIAIIGVLAAILVPAMLGYVKKSKITAANSAANDVLKTINAVLSDDNQNDSFAALTNGYWSFNVSDPAIPALENVSDDENVPLANYLGTYSNLASEDFVIYVKDGVAVAAAARSGKYFGSSPVVLNNRNYEQKMNGTYTLKQALDLALVELGITPDP